ncbi:hypothetical protein ACLOJK_031952 [Asimina triloba]
MEAIFLRFYNTRFLATVLKAPPYPNTYLNFSRQGSDKRAAAVQKQYQTEQGEFLLALGTATGDVLAVNVLTGEKIWVSDGCQSGGTTALSLANRGRTLHAAGADGMVSELNAKTGEGHVRHISVIDGGRVIISSALGEKQIQVWECSKENRTRTSMAVLSMQKPPLMLECKSSIEEDGVVVLSVSEAGIAYIWDLITTSNEGATPTRIMVKPSKTETSQQKSDKKTRIPVIAARLRAMEKGSRVSVVVAYGSPVHPQFNILKVTNPGEDIFLNDIDDTASDHPENGEVNDSIDPCVPVSEATDASSKQKKGKKKRPASDADPFSSGNNVDASLLEITDGLNNDYNMNEPTMGEKLADLNLLDATTKSKEDSSTNTNPPSADSVQVLLKQALHADDHVLLLDCLYTRDEKVITNSISMLNPADVLKFLNSLVSMIQSRGAVLVCAIPWLRSLLLQHASGIMSQESSLFALNSLFQVSDDIDDDDKIMPPIIFEDKDESDEESEDAMETDQESEDVEPAEHADSGSDFDGNDSMSD